MHHIASIAHLSDRDLLDATERVAANERHLTAELLALLGELDVRRLYLGQSCASLFTYCTQVTHAKLRRAQDLMRHTIPTGDPAVVIDRALTLLIDELERTKLAKTTRPRRNPSRRPSTSCPSSSRHIPASIRRTVWARDGGRCAFVGPRGRCTKTGRLEFHHVVPFADGGPTSVENLALRCRAHNAHEARVWAPG